MKCNSCFKQIDDERFHFYIPTTKKWLCYECYQDYKAKKKERREKHIIQTEKLIQNDLKRECRRLYKEGKKPSEIAKILNITASEVYKKLS